MRKTNWLLVAAVTCALAQAGWAQEQAMTMSLAGDWGFRLDRDGGGEQAGFATAVTEEKVRLPGSMQGQGKGDLPSLKGPWTARIAVNLMQRPKYLPYEQDGNFLSAFWLTPERIYVGPAWFTKDVEVPASWTGKQVVLHLERAHWETAVFVDGKAMGTRNSLGVPHDYELTDALPPGKHHLAIRVDNRVKIPVGVDASSVSDQTQTNWNGLIGDLQLTATDKVYIEDVQVYPNLKQRTIHVKVEIGNATSVAVNGTLTDVVTVGGPSSTARQTAAREMGEHHSHAFSVAGTHGMVEFDAPALDSRWDEFQPALQTETVSIEAGGAKDEKHVTFGMRELGQEGTNFTMNGRKIFLRGTLECCIFPLTGYPPTDVGSWRKIFRQAKAMGLNFMRFHSWCPPEAAFAAADEEGMYLYVEGSCWTAFGSGGPLDTWIGDETERMLKAYGNHPSFLLMSAANESARQDRNQFLEKLVAKWGTEDSRHRYTAAAGWPTVPTAGFQIQSPPRMQATKELDREPETTTDYRTQISRFTVPVVSHEIGQWCVYPNFDEIKKYTGTLKPGNLIIFKDFLDKSGMGAQAHDFLMASGKFQAILYKEEIEEALRTPGMGGFALLDVHDFPGQGTAPVGVLDAFWEEKGYITAAEYHRFCGETVPLARLAKRIYTSDEIMQASVQVAQFGAGDMKGAAASWELRTATGEQVDGATFAARDVPTGGLTDLGNIRVDLSKVKAPAKCRLTVSLPGGAENGWDVWVYPSIAAPPPADVAVSSALDEKTMAALEAGGKVLLMPGPAGIAGDTHGTFSPIFWNRITFPNATIHTLGILCDPKHPALADFPTDFHSNWQWQDLQSHSKPVVMDRLPKDLMPVVQVIDDWDSCRKLGLVIEAKVGKGKLLLSAIDLATDLDKRPVARQLRASLLEYMAGVGFEPKVELTADQVRGLLAVGG